MQRKAWHGIYTAFVCFFLFASSAWALPIPSYFREFLLEHNRSDLIEKFEKIPTLDPDSFLKHAASEPFALLGAGYNGVVFKTQSRHIIKFVREIFNFRAEGGGAWQGIRKYPVLDAQIPHKTALKDRPRNPNESATEKELFGNLLWAVYEPQAEDELPDFVSEDRLAYHTKFVEGVPLKKILKAQKEETIPADVRFDPVKLWQEIIKKLDLAEKMLLDLGITIDTINPDNFLVSGTYDHPVVRIIDRELVQPSKETYRYYLERGHVIPTSPYTKFRKLVHWPLFPDHIVFSGNHWNLSYEQSLLYIQARYRLSREAAVEYLARIPRAPIDFVPGQTDYSHIDRAQATILCSGLLDSQNP